MTKPVRIECSNAVYSDSVLSSQGQNRCVIGSVVSRVSGCDRNLLGRNAPGQDGVLAPLLRVVVLMFCLGIALDWAYSATPGTAKPSVGAVLNPQHPLGNGLVVCPLINEGVGQSLWDGATSQPFIMDNPLVWVSLPQTVQYPWAGPALRFNELKHMVEKLA